MSLASLSLVILFLAVPPAMAAPPGKNAKCDGYVKAAAARSVDFPKPRSALLKECEKVVPDCEGYAKSATSQSGMNETGNCGFTGAEWSTDPGAHFAWCMSEFAQGDAREELRDEAKSRQAMLWKCAAKAHGKHP